MKVGTILLTKSNKYCGDYGILPKRPKHDKAMLTELLKVEGIVSSDGYYMLPPSIREHVVVTGDRANTDYAPVTIRELAKSDLLIVSRSSEDFEGGKEFRLDNFKCLVKDRKVELWIFVK